MQPVDHGEAPARAASLGVANVLVPMDGSEAAERALPAAAALASAVGAGLHVVAVGVETEAVETLAEHVVVPAGRFGASVEARVAVDEAAAILGVARHHAPSVLVMASEGRGRLGALLGSLATALLRAGHEPIVLVGPHFEEGRRPSDGPVIACVDGSWQSEQSIPVAAAWSATLGTTLTIVTVAEPVPPSFDGRHPHRAHGPEDPEGYLADLVDRWRGSGTEVSGLVLYDPISPADGLAHHLAPVREGPAPAALLCLTSHARTGLQRMALGSQAAAIVRSSPVPVVVVPMAPLS